MADKQMNQFTTATDGAYIYAEASNGSQVKISKAALIDLFRKQIGVFMIPYATGEVINGIGLIIKTDIQFSTYNSIRLEMSFGTCQNSIITEHFIINIRIWERQFNSHSICRDNYTPQVCKFVYAYVDSDNTVSLFIDTGTTNQSFSKILASVTDGNSGSCHRITSLSPSYEAYSEGSHSKERKITIS